MPLHLRRPRTPFFPGNEVISTPHTTDTEVPFLRELFPVAKCQNLQGSFQETTGEISSAGGLIQGTAYKGLKRAGGVKGEGEAA